MATRKAVVIGLALVAAALLLGACGRAVGASGNITKGAAGGDAVDVVAEDNAFSPEVIRAEPGEEVTVEVVNQGGSPHNFVVSEIDVSTGTIEPGAVVTATFVMPASPAEYVCTFHGGMKGQLLPS